MEQHFNIRVTGKVQGVFYRASTQKKASALGINGWVSNEPDGSVYIEAEAQPDVLNELVAWCKSGPDRAKVENVEVSVSNELKHFDVFEVRH